jgi:hypothetical protein
MRDNTTKAYEHLPLNVPMEMGTASYWIASEDRVPFNDREVLCIVRDTDCITSCCGASQGFRSVGVLGYIAEWHVETRNELPVSNVEPIADDEERKELTRVLQHKYRVAQVEFL